MIKILLAGDLALDWVPGISLGRKLKKIISGRAFAAKSVGGDIGSAGLLTRAAGAVMSENIASGLMEKRKNYDFFCLNLECAMTGRGLPLAEKRYTMRADPAMAVSLRDMDVSAVCLANNHILDYGVEGLVDTVTLLEQMKIAAGGLRYGESKSQKPLILEKGGEKVGLLNYVQPGIIDPAPESYFRHDPCPFPLEEEAILLDIKAGRETAPLIVILHWGEEWSFLEDEGQRNFARACIDSGAAAVVSHHTHLAGGWEEYKGHPIFYGLGNLYMYLPPFSTRRAERRLLAGLSFENGRLTGYEAIPLVSSADGYPVIQNEFDSASLRSESCLKGLEDFKNAPFDSYRDLKTAVVMAGQKKAEQSCHWRDSYLNEFDVIQGKLPLGPGWQAVDRFWTGLAQSREFADRQYWLAVVTHMKDEAVLSVSFAAPASLSKLALVFTFPEWFHPRPEFVIPGLELSRDETVIFRMESSVPSKDWEIRELTLDGPVSSINITFRGCPEKFSYLAWRIFAK